MSIRRLKKEIDKLKDELYMLYCSEPNLEMFREAKHDLEYKIACLEEKLEMEQKLNPLRLMLFGFTIIACGLLIWAYVARN